MKFGVVGNIRKDLLTAAFSRLLATAEKRPVELVVHDELARFINKESGKRLVKKADMAPLDELVEHCEIVVALGGDGTILSAARTVGRASVPILGINLGKLGFLAELAVDEVEAFIDDVLNGQHVVEERMVIKAAIDGAEDALFALNDIVIDKGVSSRVIDVETHVNNDYLVTYTGDGLIVATPTGSTGYSLAAGGPIVVPTSETIIVTPICPHTLIGRPVILPDGALIRVKAESQGAEIRVTADGQQEFRFPSPVQLAVQKADYTVKLVRRKDKSYYDVLRSKLMWGQDVRIGRVE